MAEIRKAPSNEAIDTSGRGRVAILNPSQILLFAHLTDLTGKLLIHPYRQCLMDERRV